MKRIELLKQLKKEGCIFFRTGSGHDIYINPKTGQNNQFQDIQRLIIYSRIILKNT